MHVFYIPDIVAGGIYNLDKEESYHCVRVLRLRDRDEVMITDGKGGLYQGALLWTAVVAAYWSKTPWKIPKNAPSAYISPLHPQRTYQGRNGS